MLTYCAHDSLDRNQGEKMWLCHLSPKDAAQFCKVNSFWSEILIACSFWSEILIAWSYVNYHQQENREEVLNEIIWLNSDKCQDKVLLWHRWINKGIIQIKNLSDSQDVPYTATDLGVNCLELKTLLKCIPESWWLLLEAKENNREKCEKLYNELVRNVKNVTKRVYRMLFFDDNNMYKYASRDFQYTR